MTQRTLLVSLLILAACGDDDDDSSSYKSSCADACERAHECSSTVDVRECADDCEDEFEQIGPQLSRAYLAGLDECFEEQSCSEFALSALTNRCDGEARAKLSPSDAAEAMCERITDSIEGCTGLDVGMVGCLNTAKVFADGPLRSASRCSEQPCDKLSECVRDALGLDLNGSGS